ncbi:MAG: GGDEF domain-containing protein [Syntrophales bacterium]
MNSKPENLSCQEHALENVIEVLRTVVFDQSAPPKLSKELAAHQGLAELFKALVETRNFLIALSYGDLDSTVSFRGRYAGALKALQSNLRHFTWQTQQIASGDLAQKVVFMGEFSSAFNTMVGQLKTAQEELMKLAIHDSLTGLYNRRVLMESLGRELARGTREKIPIAVMMIDIDHFKQVNDKWGHVAGDNVLIALADVFKSNLRASDISARYGGDEFTIVLPGAALEIAFNCAEKIRKLFESTAVNTGEDEIRCTFSLGLAIFPEHGVTPGELIKAADAALYRSKSEGDNRVSVASYGNKIATNAG